MRADGANGSLEKGSTCSAVSLSMPQLSSQDYIEYLEFGGPALAQVPMMGGWSQLRLRCTRNQFNVADGNGGGGSSELAQDSIFFATLQYPSPRNQSVSSTLTEPISHSQQILSEPFKTSLLLAASSRSLRP
jgi:hypothetical protein